MTTTDLVEGTRKDELPKPSPAVRVSDVEGKMAELAKQLTPPEGGRLRAEVLRIFDGGLGAYVRDVRRAMVEVRLEQPLTVERGTLIEVEGVPELATEALPVGLRVVWKGVRAKNCGVSQRFRARKTFVEKRAARLPFETPRVSEGLRSNGLVRVVTSRTSKALEDVQAAAVEYRWMKLDLRFCEDVRDPGSLAAALEPLIGLVRENDVVLVTRDGGELADLDAFEDERVIEALASLTERCATVLAIGEGGAELMTSQVVTHRGETPTASVHLIARETWERADPWSGETRSTSPEAPQPILPGAPVVTSKPERASRRPPADSRAENDESIPRHAAAAPARSVRWLLLAAAACMGWWARGYFGDREAARDQQSDARSVVTSSAAPGSSAPGR
jgi:hypothetical protein